MIKKIKNIKKTSKILILLGLLCVVQSAFYIALRYFSNKEQGYIPEVVDEKQPHWNTIIDGKYYSKEDIEREGMPTRKIIPQW